MMLRHTALPVFLACLALAGCQSDETEDESTNSANDARYDILFDTTYVHRLDITLDSGDYAAMQANLEELVGSSGGRPRPGEETSDEDPMYVAAQISIDGETLDNVGMRYKGNSSLSTLTREGNRKKPFRLNMDKMKDLFPETDDQELLGFEEMTFSPNYLDDSQLREAFAAQLFADFGVPSAAWSFVEVHVDTGNGPEYWGLYTMLEDPSDNPFRKRWFTDDDGNMYKPESSWSQFSEAEFEKKTNEDEADYSDVQSAVAALNSSRDDAEAWRAELETVLDVDAFLSWLAMSTVMQNWDAYGSIAHNSYLYGDPLDDGRLVWIPWDHNEALLDKQGPGGGFTSTTPAGQIFYDNTGTEWPLIHHLLEDPVYREIYASEVARATTGTFETDTAMARLQELHDLIAPSVEAEVSGSQTTTAAAFQSSLASLESHIDERHGIVEEALDAQ